MSKYWISYGLSAFLGAVVGITALSAIAQSPWEQYRVVTMQTGEFQKVEQMLNIAAAQGWRLHTYQVVPGANWLIFERK